ncbi:hypothetical protein GCM10023084_62740 [Streptomyces lacrimifluminis]|uniref:HTH marR-type domain-containing protein n=1 Tax=Streptomyces lacrimifluminis TaxID=1500077 RepID=A0A917NZ19_9ACTN|nr:hypothetical protein GCM10012282_43790 [Streptomyces lacrimifluminis]
MGPDSVSVSSWDALRAIGRRPGAGARELAASAFRSEQAFGTLAGRLVAQGLVDTDRRPGHGRRFEHHLTQNWRAAAEGGS